MKTSKSNKIMKFASSILIAGFLIFFTLTSAVFADTFNIISTDETAPVITPPATQTFEATGILTTPVLVQATATDNVDPNPIISVNTTSFATGRTIVIWTATDAAGNSSTVTSLVNIVGTVASENTSIGSIKKLYTGVSIVDYLKSIGSASDFTSRSLLAIDKGITRYRGTSTQNTQLLRMLRTSVINHTTNIPTTDSNYYPSEVSYVPDNYFSDATNSTTSTGSIDSTQPTYEPAYVVVAKKESFFTPINNKVADWIFGKNNEKENVVIDTNTKDADDLIAEANSSNIPLSRKVIILAIILIGVGGLMEWNLYRSKIEMGEVEPKPFPINKEIKEELPVDEIKDLFDDQK